MTLARTIKYTKKQDRLEFKKKNMSRVISFYGMNT